MLTTLCENLFQYKPNFLSQDSVNIANFGKMAEYLFPGKSIYIAEDFIHYMLNKFAEEMKYEPSTIQKGSGSENFFVK